GRRPGPHSRPCGGSSPPTWRTCRTTPRPAARAEAPESCPSTTSPRRSPAASAAAPAGNRWSPRPPSQLASLTEPVRPPRPHHPNRTVEPPTIVVGGFPFGGLVEYGSEPTQYTD